MVAQTHGAQCGKTEFDSPLTWRLDETDAIVLCENVKVPWERVFCINDATHSYRIYNLTPSHCYGNHQSNVRFLAKLRLHCRAWRAK